MQSLKGKTALITGASRGIGKAAARALAKEGVHLGLIATSQKSLQEIIEELSDADISFASAGVDISKEEEVQQAVKQLEDELGAFDIIINNAGIGTKGDFLDISTEEWEKVFQVNVMGTVHITKAALPGMMKKNKGDIINISSMSGLKGTKGSSAYSASKFAVLGLSESLMQEVRHYNIRVSALTPSLVETDLTRGDGERNPDKFMQAEDLAEYMVSQLKLEQRTFIKTAAMWGTNPF
ncbi:3-ketoacyl-ACP reductase [Alkalicoccus daliensis]|uniref:3-oxoacyl-[acyl-carrier protein] reductase n=1 Tax=Alkalicoccus daliensis TaxID=745820 RepID=A0A1H0HV57_9BACI|nr:3-ketoacyl-ACP reductase [Alkalicoccus daliensis]SDO23046.1 3-oxoacyl-[acyl-carrier protein] reductase [Alkalicoccus daliensis]